MVGDVFGFAEHQDKALYGLGYKLILTINKNEAVLDNSVDIADAIIKIDLMKRYVPHYTPFIQQQSNLSKQSFCKTPTEIRFIERSVLMKEVKNRNL